MRTSFKIVSVILGILMIASGIYCLATPGITFLAVGWIIGFNMIADAIGNIFTWRERKDEGMKSRSYGMKLACRCVKNRSAIGENV